jgi:pre-mRNA-splicing factor SYF2
LTYYQNKARKENEHAMVVEKKRMEPRGESRSLSKEKWLEDRKKNTRGCSTLMVWIMSKSYILDTMAEAKLKKREKEPATHGWDGELIS